MPVSGMQISSIQRRKGPYVSLEGPFRVLFWDGQHLGTMKKQIGPYTFCALSYISLVLVRMEESPHSKRGLLPCAARSTPPLCLSYPPLLSYKYCRYTLLHSVNDAPGYIE